MAKCRLGEKKLRKIEELTGHKVEGAFVRGGWDHYWAETFFIGQNYTIESPPPMVNYKTGEIKGGSPTMKILRQLSKLTMQG